MQLDLALDDGLRVCERVSTRARHIRIELRHDGSVRLVYPRWVPRREAWAFLRSRESWVREQLAAQAAQQAEHAASPLAWGNEDRIPLRGVPQRIQVQPARLRRAAVRFETAQISIFIAPEQMQPGRLEAALRLSLQQQARLDAQRLLEGEAARLAVRYARLRIMDPRTQWGSCNSGAVIALSWRLVMAPPEVFRYVVVHELCHLVHMDHSAAFWALVERQMPEFAAHKAWLREHGASLHRVLARAGAA